MALSCIGKWQLESERGRHGYRSYCQVIDDASLEKSVGCPIGGNSLSKTRDTIVEQSLYEFRDCIASDKKLRSEGAAHIEPCLER